MSATPSRPHGSGSVAGRFYLSVLSTQMFCKSAHMRSHRVPCHAAPTLTRWKAQTDTSRVELAAACHRPQPRGCSSDRSTRSIGRSGTRTSDERTRSEQFSAGRGTPRRRLQLHESMRTSRRPGKREAVSLCQPKDEDAQLERGKDMTAESPSQNQHVFETDRRGLHARLVVVGGERAEGAVLVLASSALAGP